MKLGSELNDLERLYKFRENIKDLKLFNEVYEYEKKERLNDSLTIWKKKRIPVLRTDEFYIEYSVKERKFEFTTSKSNLEITADFIDKLHKLNAIVNHYNNT